MTDLALLPDSALQVLTDANPQADWLLQARSYLQVSPVPQAAIQQYVREGLGREWLEDRLCTLLVKHFGPEHAEAVQECGIYLAAELDQFKKPVLVDSVSGRAIRVLTEADLHTPAPVLRESGNLVARKAALLPALEAALTIHAHDTARDRDLLEELSGKLPSTDLLRQEGDARLKQATKRGRRGLGDQVLATAPLDILKACSGRLKACWGSMIEVPAEGQKGRCPIDVTLTGRLTRNVSDSHATNYSFGGYQSLLTGLANGLVTGILDCVIRQAPSQGSLSVDQVAEHFKDHLGIVVAHPDARKHLANPVLVPTARVGEVVKGIGYSDLRPVGNHNYELSGQWVLEYRLACRLWIPETTALTWDLVVDTETQIC